MGDLKLAFSADNLHRAWLWTLTNREAQYKNHFRHVYRAYSLAQDRHLSDLRERLIKETFAPTHATKLYFPKKSGLQRTFSLLAVEDQIVYQSLVNVIAEKLFAHMRQRYYRSVFGNLYAGKRSLFFFNDWKRGYTKFSKAIRSAYSNGLKFSASFDLTACYDSIDHAVLKHFLQQLGLDAEFCNYLNSLLSHWTASSSEEPIYHGHGIPQGPQASGLLAESVLSHFDEYMASTPTLKYFRYVDDIRLFAKSEIDLRHALVKLDLLSREVGLFPQSSKIEIHKVVNVEDEIKSISNPPESSVATEDPDQELVRERLYELTRNYRVKEESRFKYVLGRAAANAELTKRLLRVVEAQPHLYIPIFRYIGKSTKLSKVCSKQALDLLNSYELYPAFSAALIVALTGSVHGYAVRRLKSYCNALLKRRNLDVNLRVASCVALIEHGGMNKRTLLKNLLWNDWWVRSQLLPRVLKRTLDPPSYERLINRILRDRTVDASVVAAELCIDRSVPVERPITGINRAAQVTLREAGLIGRATTGQCPISVAMVELLGKSVSSIDWRKLFGKRYKEVMPKIVAWRGYAKTDASGWVNVSDTINEYLLDELYKHDSTLGTYTLGKIGSNLSSTRLASGYPKLLEAVKAVHEARLQSQLSHPVVKQTGKPTRRIKFHEIEALQRKLRYGYVELWTRW